MHSSESIRTVLERHCPTTTSSLRCCLAAAAAASRSCLRGQVVSLMMTSFAAPAGRISPSQLLSKVVLCIFLCHAVTGASFGPCTTKGTCINVLNNCSAAFRVHGWNNAAPKYTLQPDNYNLLPGAVMQYSVPSTWAAARVEAHLENGLYDKVELTVGGGFINYDITYVDYIAIPSAMQAIGLTCKQGPGCYVPRAQLLAKCPSHLLASNGSQCISAGLYCSYSAHMQTPFCHALDKQIAICAAAAPSTCGLGAKDTTDNAYSCSGYFDGQPGHPDGNKWCAALNRGMLQDPESSNASKYYVVPPYNAFAKFVHTVCPGIYAFPYDDYHGQGGDRSCVSNRLDITFCPRG